MHRRLTASVGVATAALALSVTAPAAGDASGFGFTDGPTVVAGAGDAQPGAAPNSNGGGSSGQRCDYVRLDPDHSDATDRMAREGLWSPRDEGPGAWFRKICTNGNGLSSGTIVWVRDRVPTEQLAQQALERVPLPQPLIRMNPPEGAGAVTNVETWLWIDPSQWQPVTASASAGGVTVTTTATPDHVVFTMGNGDSVTCRGPGTPYEPARPAAEQTTRCGYTYRRSSAHQPGGRYVVTATVSYRVGWSASGIAGGGALAPVRQSGSVPLRVAEIQTLNQ